MIAIIEKTIDLLKKQNISHFEINAYSSIGVSVSTRMLELENNTRYQNQKLEIDVVKDGRSGSFATVDISDNGIKNAIKNAVSLAEFSSLDKFNTLADKSLMATKQIDLDIFYPYELTKEQGFEIASICEQNALNNPKISNSEGSEVISISGSNYYANSYGVIMTQKYSSHSINCSLVAQGKNDMQTGYDYDSSFDFNNLADPQTIGINAAKNTINKLNSRLIKSGKYPVIFSNKVSSSIISHILSALTGGSQYKKSSFLLDSLGNIILPRNINILENPLQKRTIGSKFFDADGVKKRKQFFVEDGLVKSYILSQYSANQLNSKTTANSGGVNNVEVITNDCSFDELVKTMGRGIIIDELIGQGVNLVTGDYSRGVSGFMVENGAISYPVSGITVAANLKDMLKNIVKISSDVDKRKNIKVGSILIDDMTIAGI